MSGIADSAAGTAISGVARGPSNVAAISVDKREALGNYAQDILASVSSLYPFAFLTEISVRQTKYMHTKKT